MSCYFERRDPTENAFRFYGLDLDQDLFGTWCVTRRWGRIGAVGQHKIDSFADRSNAVSFYTKIETLKRSRGYCIVRGGAVPKA